MFSDDFLNPYAYTELTAADDNEALRELGKALFYDPRLSATGTLSCASCHRPELAFTDGVARSTSNQAGQTVVRNAPTLLNAVYADRYFYDLRTFTLEQQAEHVVFDGAEFSTAYATIVGKINADKDYKQLIKSALSQRRIDRDGFRAALASYVLSLRPFNSPFDCFARGETDELAPAAYRGFNLFMGKAACGTCHFAPTFSGLVPPAYVENETEIWGVPASPYRLRLELDADRGRAAGGIHYEDAWIYERSFKTPTVRNVAETAPYFHHGTYATLDLVVDFYNRGGGTGLGLEVLNQTLPPAGPGPSRALTQLTFLNLMGNYLEQWDARLETLTGLQTLNFRGNGLKKLPYGVSRLTALESLDLSENDLKALPDALGLLRSLRYLRVSGNNLVDLPTALGRLRALTTLEARHNQLSRLPEPARGWRSLVRLNLGYNQLRDLPKGWAACKSLQSLSLEFNYLQKLPTSFGKLRALRSLLLTNNALKEVPAALFQLRELELLVLANNQLTSLPKDLSRWGNLKTLILTGNPLPISEVERARVALPNCRVLF